MAKVLKSFKFAADGFTIETLNEGDDRDFGGSLQGLVKEGYVEGVIETAEDETAPTGGKKKK